MIFTKQQQQLIIQLLKFIDLWKHGVLHCIR